MIKCSLVIPCYNEAESIPIFIDKVSQSLANYENIEPRYIFVDDGSSDQTIEVLKEVSIKNKNVIIVELSRNFGKEAALSAGLSQADGDIVIPMDVDLQDPPELIPEMINKWREGYDVVLPQRISRDSDGVFKRLSAKWFYNFINWISPLRIPPNVGDFRLMSREVVRAVNKFPENCRFMKGLFAFTGFRSVIIPYERPKRSAGVSKFNFWKLFTFSLDGITGFSIAPLRFFGIIGFFISIISISLALFFLFRTIFFGVDVPGYASLIVAISFLGGIQILGIGLLGEYLGRTYIESKNRPAYIIRAIHKENKEQKKSCRKNYKTDTFLIHGRIRKKIKNYRKEPQK